MAEIETLRANYRRHREALKRMAAEAPTDALAQEYQRLVMSIDGALAKLDELDRGGADAPLRLKTDPGVSPLTQPLAEPVYDGDETRLDYEPPEGRAVSNGRLALIVCAGVLVLAFIGWLIWRASSDRKVPATANAATAAPAVVETTASDTDTIAPAGEPPAAAQLSVTPESHDYGTIRKGTRATRQFEIANSSDAPMQVVVARSACRCLFYEHRNPIPAKGKETITVTIDGARAKAGELHETIKVSSKNEPSILTSFDVTATVR